jgi:hypothetical protein
LKFDGFVSSVREDTAFITLKSNLNGEELLGTYSASKFLEMGIKENRRFVCQVGIFDGYNDVDVRFKSIPDEQITPEEESRINEEIDNICAGLSEDD